MGREWGDEGASSGLEEPRGCQGRLGGFHPKGEGAGYPRGTGTGCPPTDCPPLSSFAGGGFLKPEAATAAAAGDQEPTGPRRALLGEDIPVQQRRPGLPRRGADGPWTLFPPPPLPSLGNAPPSPFTRSVLLQHDPSSQTSVVAGVAVVALNRPQYLERTLSSIEMAIKRKPDWRDKFPLFVSQDGTDKVGSHSALRCSSFTPPSPILLTLLLGKTPVRRKPNVCPRPVFSPSCSSSREGGRGLPRGNLRRNNPSVAPPSAASPPPAGVSECIPSSSCVLQREGSHGDDGKSCLAVR